MGTCTANLEAAEFSLSVDVSSMAAVFAHVQPSHDHACFCAGKVHGSLARAGKVRGQAPKVPKQEKKKKPTGRAMKRIKYNRRFVNVGACLLPARRVQQLCSTPKRRDQ